MSRSLDERAGQADPSSGSGVRLKVWGKRARGVDLCCKYALRTHTTWKSKSIRMFPPLTYCRGLRATTRQRIDHVGLNFELIPEFLLFLLVKPLLRNLRGENVGPEVKWSREKPVLISARQLYLLYYLLCILTDHSPTLLFLLPFPSNHILSYAY